MKVMEMRDAWGVEHIKPGTRPDRSPGAGDVLIRMQAASVNYRDLVMTQRGYGRHSGELPIVPLSDGAGVVSEIGAGVTRVKIGDLVCPAFAQSWFSGALREAHRPGMLGGPLDGVMQEYMLLPEAGVVKAPAQWSAVEAATLPCAALTAWSAVIGAGVKPGDVVVTQGTGGVSLFALHVRQGRRRHDHHHLVERREARARQGAGRRYRHQLPHASRMEPRRCGKRSAAAAPISSSSSAAPSRSISRCARCAPAAHWR